MRKSEFLQIVIDKKCRLNFMGIMKHFAIFSMMKVVAIATTLLLGISAYADDYEGASVNQLYTTTENSPLMTGAENSGTPDWITNEYDPHYQDYGWYDGDGEWHSPLGDGWILLAFAAIYAGYVLIKKKRQTT